MPSLTIRNRDGMAQHFALNGAAFVGRHSSCTIVLEDDRVSRQHLELRPTEKGWKAVDLGSGNGTRVNGLAITECDLKPGDEITVGDTRLIFDEESRFRSSILRSVPASAGPQLLANLGVLYEAATAVSHILDVDELLGRILDLVLNATGADHAAALLTDPGTGELMPRVVRSRDGDAFAFSRTIVDHVLREGQGVLAGDAAADERFAGGESIVRHALREVIATPMRGRHDTLGVLFLDTIVSAGRTRFSADHLNLAVALAHQAALALEETRYYRALLEAERLAVLGQTIAGMSHHIKNVMQGLRFGGDMIRSGLAEDDRSLIEKGWTLLEKNQKRIDRLIQDMLSFSKERTPDATPTDLVQVLDDALELVRGRVAEIGIALSVDRPEPGLLVNCDSEGIHAAILNVLGNAVDALQNVPDPVLNVQLRYEPSSAVIVIEDNGPGVPVEQREAVFQPFISTKGRRGTGLGLPVSRKTLREHGGDLTIDDAAGAKFVLRIPRDRQFQ